MNDFFDVCILGAGSAGMAAAYVLTNKRKLDLSWVSAQFVKSGQSNQLVFDIQALAQKYWADMQRARVTVLTECAFVRVAERDRERITGIELQDETGKKQLIWV